MFKRLLPSPPCSETHPFPFYSLLPYLPLPLSQREGGFFPTPSRLHRDWAQPGTMAMVAGRWVPCSCMVLQVSSTSMEAGTGRRNLPACCSCYSGINSGPTQTRLSSSGYPLAVKTAAMADGGGEEGDMNLSKIGKAVKILTCFGDLKNIQLFLLWFGLPS